MPDPLLWDPQGVASGRTRFYADANIDANLVEFLREKGFRVDYAQELGLGSRDDEFHLQEAKRQKAVLLTRDRDFLDNKKFPFHRLRGCAIVVIMTNLETADRASIGYTYLSLIQEIGTSGIKNLSGLKIELLGPKIKFHAVVGGKLRTDEADISKTDHARVLFADEKEST